MLSLMLIDVLFAVSRTVGSLFGAFLRRQTVCLPCRERDRACRDIVFIVRDLHAKIVAFFFIFLSSRSMVITAHRRRDGRFARFVFIEVPEGIFGMLPSHHRRPAR